MEFTNTLLFRRNFAEKSSQLVVFFILVALFTCNLIVEQHIIFTWLGLFDLVLAIIVWQLIAHKIVTYYSAHLVITSCWIYTFPLILLSGGVDSHFVFLVPLSPLMAGLLFDTKTAFFLCWFLFFNILLLVLLIPKLPDFVGFTYEHDEQLLKAYWLVFATIISTVFVAYFHRFNRMMSRMLQDQALKDPLTGLFNRRSLMDLIEVNIELAERNGSWLSLIMIDIDDFKLINDRYGHNAGDQCLVRIARTLSRSLRKNDDAVGRWGGEEFLVILSNVDQKRTREIANSIRANIAALEIIVDGVKIPVTATLGCYCSNKGAIPSTSDMVKQADEAMYEGKKSGKNQVAFYSG